MPELPEIALQQEYVEATCLQQKIIGVEVKNKGPLQAPQAAFESALIDHQFEETERLGKYLLVRINNGQWLVFHFGMTGSLEYCKKGNLPKYTQFVVQFQNDFQLAYACRRKLGKIFLSSAYEDFQLEHSLGEDAMDVKEKQFLELLDGKTGSIKGVLTDQHVIAGIGNVYADEILYQARVHPKTKANLLAEKEKLDLHKKMLEILQIAIAKDGARKELPEGFLTRQRREGASCPDCSGKIEKIKVSGRSTYFCPACQTQK